MSKRILRYVATVGASLAFVQLAVLCHANAQIRKADDVSLENLIEESKGAVEALEALGRPIGDADRKLLEEAWLLAGDEAKGKIQEVVDRYCWIEIRIDDEAWLKAEPASPNPADRRLAQGRWTPFLVKIYNQSDVQSAIHVRSPQELPPAELAAAEQRDFNKNADPHAWYRWLGVRFHEPAREAGKFRGVTVRYRVMSMLSRDEGLRAADLEFYFGGGAVSQGHYVKKRLLFEVTPHSDNGPGVKAPSEIN